MADIVTLNREVFDKDPLTWTMPNNGVAAVAENADAENDEVLKYELRTFVCEGEYGRGLEKILRSYLDNIGKPTQPAVWVSGFYGSGKSHLVKMLRYLWTDSRFADGSTARGLVTMLPQDVTDSLVELSRTSRQYGGLRAVAGTLGAGAGSIRLSLLALLYRGAGLPEEYHVTQCVLWLRHEGVYDAVKATVEATGANFAHELKRLYVSSILVRAIIQALPSFAGNEAEAHASLRSQFQPSTDLTINQTLDAMDQILSANGKMPCTLIVLDEVQQYIGDDPKRSSAVQELTEACSKRFGGQLLFVATGQDALIGTPMLQRLMDRSTVAVHLSDTDVETVTRQIVLRKAPSKQGEIAALLETCSGEIRRHLTGTRIRPSTEDNAILVADYPILPVRRRFWEKVLRAVDRAGTTGQLRNQLRVVFDAVRHVADRPLGHVVAADFIFHQLSANMLRTGVLQAEVNAVVGRQQTDGKADGELRSRLCAAIFLITSLPREGNADEGIRATPDTLADLLVEDLRTGSADLRRRLPELLEGLVETGDLIKIDDEYRIQTRESAKWTADFQGRLAKIINNDSEVAHQRADRLRAAVDLRLRNFKLLQGESKTPRKLEQYFGVDKIGASGAGIPVWIRDGWTVSDTQVLQDAREAGDESSTIFVFLPRRAVEEFRKALAGLKAATDTLDHRGPPGSPDGREARDAMETRRAEYERDLSAAVTEILGGARVFQGGGHEIAMDLEDAVQAAAEASLKRRYPRFSKEADNTKWEKVLEQARKGQKAPLEILGYQGEALKHPVCMALLQAIGNGKKGSELRKEFMAPPYGWPQDTVDGALLALLAADCIRAMANGAALKPSALTGPVIGTAEFKTETVNIRPGDRIDVKLLLQTHGVQAKQGEESGAIPELLRRLEALAESAGGAAPLPPSPNTEYLAAIGRGAGNAQIRDLAEAKARIDADVPVWRAAASKVGERLPRWETLRLLLAAGDGLPDMRQIADEAQAITDGRRLLDEPDPTPPLGAASAELLRRALTQAQAGYQKAYDQHLSELRAENSWGKLDKAEQERVLAANALSGTPEITVGTDTELLASAKKISVNEWRSRTDALTQRFANARAAARQLVAPKAQVIRLPRTSLTTVEEARAWQAQLEAVGREVLRLVENDTPVVVE